MSVPSPVQRLRTSGVVSLEGGEFGVENNVWIVGDEDSAIVVDAAHDHEAIARALGDRELMAIVATHGHGDHVNAAVDLADLADCPILLHPDDAGLWHRVHPYQEPDAPLLHGEALTVGDVELDILHTPGHTPGGVCLYAPGLGVVLTGDTLSADGPGATGRHPSDLPTLIASIREHLMGLPGDTVVLPGHGEPTTVAEAAEHLDDWAARGF
ncbi:MULTISPECIES: MBL fold metallo-hydrolase [Nocardiopsis]|uniref:MBL fold metallo-hydrolase n=1 Tax=Nocardiopsis sinuspersici TaxID=501010 RepID=A0A1V3C3U0_9ACTN|nr:MULTISPECIES: MBL fold metallo-hydrolase [Nocardiopsis]OOC55464.1 MBL fold metallo-hydrolase [Nocardiopsis sinuspersici]